MNIHAIFATDAKGGVGQAGRMPWPRLINDLNNFKRLTLNNIIIMGRKTWESVDMRNPLPHRTSAVWTTQGADQLPLPSGVIRLSGSPDDWLASMFNAEPACHKNYFVIGGAETLTAWMPLCSVVYQTEIINKSYDCDTVFLNSQWQTEFEVNTCDTIIQDQLTYNMRVWSRK
jgi:dihydrofolate reductase